MIRSPKAFPAILCHICLFAGWKEKGRLSQDLFVPLEEVPAISHVLYHVVAQILESSRALPWTPLAGALGGNGTAKSESALRLSFMQMAQGRAQARPNETLPISHKLCEVSRTNVGICIFRVNANPPI